MSGREQTTENWYRVDISDALCCIENSPFLTNTLARASSLPGSWIKILTFQAEDLETSETRYWWQISLRPYIQGYGCDGTTDANIHALAMRFGESCGFHYPDMLIEAYPQSYLPCDVFDWLEDEGVIAETYFPEQIDPILLLDDLGEINNHTLADILGTHLVEQEVIPADWVHALSQPKLSILKQKAQACYLAQ
jgi:hypothetical protein